MEVAVAVPPPPPTPMNFNFHRNCSSPYIITAPSSPQRFCNQQLNNTNNNNDGNEDFEFDSSGHLLRPSLSADELFDGGKIRLLNLTTPNIPSSTEKNIAQAAVDKKDSCELVVGQHPASTESRWGQSQHDPKHLVTSSSNKNNGFSSLQRGKQQKRGRQRDSSSSHDDNNNKDKGVSSLISETAISSATSTYCASLLSSNWFTKGYRKWKLKDFLLFRSASEGRGTDKDPLRKYSVLSKMAAYEDAGNCSFRSKKAAWEDAGNCSFRSKTTAYEDVGSCSFRSTDESSGSVSRRRVSAHELHYTVNRAASEELKKKTLLPYKHGLLGCLRFNTGSGSGSGSGMHYISTGIGSLERS